MDKVQKHNSFNTNQAVQRQEQKPRIQKMVGSNTDQGLILLVSGFSWFVSGQT
jgi:hypothetical protein